MNNPPKMVKVTWKDSRSAQYWMSHQEAINLKPSFITTVGFLVSDKEDSYVIASSWTHDHVGGVTVVTKSQTISFEVIEREKQ